MLKNRIFKTKIAQSFFSESITPHLNSHGSGRHEIVIGQRDQLGSRY